MQTNEEIRKEFWIECAEDFNESQEWLFEKVADFWLNKMSLQKQQMIEKVSEEIQKDLDAGGFNMICSKESNFKAYVIGLLSKIINY